MSENCLLCQSEDVTVLESLSVGEINKLYKYNFGVLGAIKYPELSYMYCNNCALRYFFPGIAGEERLYERLQTYDWYYMSDKPEYKIASRYINDDESILEIGAGRAAFGLLMGKDRYKGLEYNDLAISKARSSGITLLKESVSEHAAKGKSYDVVVSFQVLEHVESPFEFIKSCVDCLNPGGKLVIAVPSHDSYCGKSINNILDMPPHHLSHWSNITLQKLSELFDLSIVSIVNEEISDYHMRWAKKTVVETAIRKIFRMQYKLIDRSVFARVISKFSDIIARFFNISLEGVRGHTVVACYEKK